MDFKDTQPIYLQIVDYICSQVVSDDFREGLRIPSARDYAMNLEVNPNTVVRAFEILQNQGVIYNKRGQGYFVAEDGKKMALTFMKSSFINDFLPLFFQNLELLDIPLSEIAPLFEKYKKQLTANEKIENG